MGGEDDRRRKCGGRKARGLRREGGWEARDGEDAEKTQTWGGWEAWPRQHGKGYG